MDEFYTKSWSLFKLRKFTNNLPQFLSQKSGQTQKLTPNWQGSQPINYKTKFSERDNIYLVDLKYNIAYQNVRGETNVTLIFIPWNT